MSNLTSRQILDAIHEGLELSALLATLGYEASRGRPGRALLNDALQLGGYGRPLTDLGPDRTGPRQSFPDEWVRDIARAVTGRPDPPVGEVIATLKRHRRDGRESRPARRSTGISRPKPRTNG
jgi:hypothetical protein